MFEIKVRAEGLSAEASTARGGEEGQHYYDVPDTHSVAIVAPHHATPISRIAVGRYEVFDQEPMANCEPLKR